MKELRWRGDSKRAVRAFPADVRSDLGFELERVQLGGQSRDSKPMPSIGQGVEELRAWDKSGTFRVIYLAKLPEAVYVLHAFQKKTQATSQSDVELARTRLRELLRER